MTEQTKQQIESEIAKLQKQLEEIKTKELEEKNKRVLVKIKLSTGTIEVEKNLHLEMNRRNLIKIPNGYRLLTLSEFLEIWNNHVDKLEWGGLPDEIVKQPIKEIEETYPYWNIWLRRLDDGDRSGLNGDSRSLFYGNSVRGVRFVKC